MSSSINNIIKGAGFHHIALKANDFNKSLEFYQKLGFSKKCSWGEGDNTIAMLDMGDGTIIELFAGGTNEVPEGRYFHLAIKADDVEEAYKIALEAGATVHNEPNIANVTTDTGVLNLNIAFVKGPDGEILEFFKFV